MNMPRPEGSYNYPVYPGMKAWDLLETENEKIQACQIPFSILESMSTQAVIQAIWEYPFFTDIAGREGLFQTDFDRIIGETNAFKELEFRRDGGKYLLERYQNMERLASEDLLVKSYEIFFAQSEPSYQLSYPERKYAVQCILEKKSKNEVSTLFLMERLMEGIFYPPLMEELERNQILKTFLETSAIDQLDDSFINKIVSNAEEFLVYKNEGYLELIKDELDCMNMPRPEGSFDYYLYPGMKEWSLFKYTSHMFTTSQIPESLLKDMSTQAVIQAIWEYPFFFELLTSIRDNYEFNFQGTIGYTNAYQELITRPGVGPCLLERYRPMDFIGASVLHPKNFELLFCQYDFLAQLSNQEKIEVVSLAFEKEFIRRKYYGQISGTAEITWFLIARTMHSARYAPFMKEVEEKENLQMFLEAFFIDWRPSQAEQSALMLYSIYKFGLQFINYHTLN
ncbi:MAG: hypothetical protein LIP05_08365 [Tannerellaceae bacterium]|nr:hypothetical protein [Tannerellaceae bacterium]